jgi:hypothetical protein
MKGYNQFIGRLKNVRADFDADAMLKGINQKVARQAQKTKLLQICLLVVLITSPLLYYNFQSYLTADQSQLAEYVLQSNALNGDQVLNYVLMD